jgi:hypothetical protein
LEALGFGSEINEYLGCRIVAPRNGV